MIETQLVDKPMTRQRVETRLNVNKSTWIETKLKAHAQHMEGDYYK